MALVNCSISVIVGFRQSSKQSTNLNPDLFIADGRSRTPYDPATSLPKASLNRVGIYQLAAQQHQERKTVDLKS